MKLNIKHTIITVAIILIIIVAAASYFGNSKDTNPTHLVVTSTGHMEEPKSGFNSLTGWGCGHLNFNPLIQSTLLTSDANGNMINDLATGYNISSDGLKWSVNIRNDVKFSNNDSLKANDVAFTFNTAKTSNSQLDMSNLDHATAIDEDTVEFTLKEAQSSFIYNLRYVGIVPEKDYNNETYGSNPIGSGPYKLKQWDKGQQAIFEFNDNYYGKKPYFTQITMLFPDESSVLELAKSSQADVVQSPITGLNQTIKGYHLVNLPAGRAQGISLPYINDTGLKTADGNPIGNNVTSDIAIRKALNIGLNRQEIVDNVYHKFGSPEYSGVDSRDYGNSNATISDNNIEEAKKTLDEAGWVDTNGDGIREKNGQNASFKLYYSSEDQARQSLATVVSEQAKELGINIELQGTDWDTIYKNMFSSAATMQQTSSDPYKSVYLQYHSKEAIDEDYMNPNSYNNTEVDSLLDKAKNSTNQNQSNEYYKQAALISSNSGFGPAGDAPWLWVATYDHCYFVKDDIDMGDVPKNMGQDFLQNICDWKRTNTTT
ncbi:MAG: ABC transporter substrate-binding protein [Methanobacteriaceae archaeon]|nr:ABC transporter substrate-binding protein [Methanobacteriaceae archaeon]